MIDWGAARKAFGVLGIVVWGGGCASRVEAPPYDELPLRDALSADPSVLAALPADERARIADALDEAARTDGATDGGFAEARAERRDGGATSERHDGGAVEHTRAVLSRIDDTRREAGKDAFAAVVIDLSPPGARGHAPRLVASPLASLPPIEGERAAPSTETIEARALAGRAGVVVRTLLAETGATRLVRVTAVPAGVYASAGTVYVNGAYLVAMGTREDEGQGGTMPSLVYAPTPKALRGNPYQTYLSLAACTGDVGARCKECLASGACDEAAALDDFPDARSECAFLIEQPKRVAQLCVVSLGSIDTIAECLRAGGCSAPSASSTRASLAGGDPILADQKCAARLDLCLGVGNGSETNVIEVEGCKDPFSACASAFSGCGKACSAGSCSGRSGQSCGSCSNGSGSSSCSGGSCKSSGGSSSGGSGGSSSCGKSCGKREVEPEGAPPPPIGVAWLAVPAIVLGARARRPARRAKRGGDA